MLKTGKLELIGSSSGATDLRPRKLEDQGLKSDTIVYSSVIDACGKAGDSERAMEVFKRMRSKGIKPHLVTYSALARPFAYRGQWREVEELAVQMRSEGHRANDYSFMLSCSLCHG